MRIPPSAPALPACQLPSVLISPVAGSIACASSPKRSEEHTSELQSPCNLVCRLLLEKKKKKNNIVSFLRKKKTKNHTHLLYQQNKLIDASTSWIQCILLVLHTLRLSSIVR